MNDIIKRIEKSELQAKKYGFYWPDNDAIMQQIHSECKEIDELFSIKESKPERLQEEIGDLLHAAISLCVYCGYDTNITLEQALNKFEKRFHQTKYFAAKDGYSNLHGKNMEEMMKYWKMAKEAVG